jgi:hypothetical protein
MGATEAAPVLSMNTFKGEDDCAQAILVEQRRGPLTDSTRQGIHFARRSRDHHHEAIDGNFGQGTSAVLGDYAQGTENQ